MRYTVKRAGRRGLATAVAAASIMCSEPSFAAAPQTQRVSISSSPAADEGNGLSFAPAVSGDGRWVVFVSAADNLVAGDTNGVMDVFRRDRQTGETIRVSVSSDGLQGNGDSGSGDVSADGRLIVFSSLATNLVLGDTNGHNDVFVRDLQGGTTVRVSVGPAGAQGNGNSHTPVISDDGRFVAFESDSGNLVPGDSNGLWDVFVHDRQAGATSRLSVASSGAQSNGDSRWASISADGRFISFTSGASTLVAGSPTGGGPIPPPTQVYVRDRLAGLTTAASLSSAGAFGSDNSLGSSISSDGRFVAFSSYASNLSPADHSANEDVFLRDRQAGTTSLQSVSSTEAQANAWCFWPAISGDGRHVAFVSDASNLAPADANARRDVFRRDVTTGETIRVSVSTAMGEGDDNSGFFFGPAVSADGGVIVFESFASNLVDGDGNRTDDVFVRDLAGPAPCGPADIDCDGRVNVDDLLMVINAWGPCDDPRRCAADVAPVGGDGVVDVDDLLLVIGHWS